MNIFENDAILNGINKTMVQSYEPDYIVGLISTPIQINNIDFADVCEFFSVLTGDAALRYNYIQAGVSIQIVNAETNEIVTSNNVANLKARTHYKLQAKNTSNGVGILEYANLEFSIKDNPYRYIVVKQSEVE